MPSVGELRAVVLPLTSPLASAEMDRLRKVLPPKRRALLEDLFARTRDALPTTIDVLKTKHGGEGGTENTTQKAIADLRASLAKDYYGYLRNLYVRGTALPPGLVLFEIENDRTISAVAIENVPVEEPASAPSTAATVDDARQRARAAFPDVECRYIKSNEEAMQYALARLPDVAVFRDTHVRPRSRFPQYTGQLLPDLEAALLVFLGSDPTHRISIVTGRFTERSYVDRLVNVAKVHPDRVDWFMLDQSTPLMNFVMLEYADHSTDVLFGFSRYEDSPREAVFLSSAPALVEEFDALRRALSAVRRKVPADKLTERLKWKGTGLKTFRTWQEKRYTRSLTRLRRRRADGHTTGDKERGDLRISTTFLRHFDDAKIDVIKKGLEAGLHVKLLLLNPLNKPLFHARFGAREDRMLPRVALKELQSQIRVLNDLAESVSAYPGTLEIRYTDLMPSGFLAHSEEWAYVGLMMAGGPHTHGPMLRVSRRSKLWKTLYEEDWRPRWKKARPAPGAPPFGTRDLIGSAVLRQDALIAFEEKLRDDAQVWVASPRLANVTGDNPPFAAVVRANAARGIRYRYVVPREDGPTPQALSELKTLFAQNPDRLELSRLPKELFFGRLMFRVSFVAYNPNLTTPEATEVYMQWPLSKKLKWWLRLYDPKVIRAVLNIMREPDAGPVSPAPRSPATNVRQKKRSERKTVKRRG
jgi:hypothetical protein